MSRLAKWKFARKNGAVVLETQEPLRSRALEYFKLVGRPDITDVSAEAWSAAFISSIITSAGAGPTQFPISAGHSRYNSVRAVQSNCQ
ncbi:DUF2272 domain-containing protein [Bradyrhizobium sp. CNPSo 4010]|uniref:DUF2272 domain-containing protein n=2 Tax=Bradyrhizobium agreste TaxID=2751811 RepID=A0ABS0PPD1_9BRAD|nr:DUF2272 domain-containing protein [Bradyrhizobium agreste]